MTEKECCPDCDKPLADEADNETFSDDGGEHLCWRRFANNTCEGDPVDWRERALKAEAEVEQLKKENQELLEAKIMKLNAERDTLRRELAEKTAEIEELKESRSPCPPKFQNCEECGQRVDECACTVSPMQHRKRHIFSCPGRLFWMSLTIHALRSHFVQSTLS